MTFINVLGIIIAFVLLITLTMKGGNAMWIALLCAAVVIFTNGIDWVEGMTVSFATSFGNTVKAYGCLFLFGSLLSELYTRSNAAVCIAQTLTGMWKPGMSTRKTMAIVTFVNLCVGVLLMYGGVQCMAAILCLYPIVLEMLRKTNLPRRYASGLCMVGTGAFGLSGPGSPQMTNIVPMDVLGTTPTAALVPGLVGSVVELFVAIALFVWWAERDQKKHPETFCYIPSEKDIKVDPDAKKPPFVVAIIPLIWVFCAFNFLSMNIVAAMAIAFLLALALFFPWLPHDTKGFVKMLNDGVIKIMSAICGISVVVGFGGVVTSSNGYAAIQNWLLSLNIHPLLQIAIIVALLAGFTGASTSAMLVGLPHVAPAMQAMGISMEAAHRVAVFAATTFDSLPSSGGMFMMIGLSGEKPSEIYPLMGLATVVTTMAGTLVVAVMCVLCGLA